MPKPSDAAGRTFSLRERLANRTMRFGNQDVRGYEAIVLGQYALLRDAPETEPGSHAAEEQVPLTELHPDVDDLAVQQLEIRSAGQVKTRKQVWDAVSSP